MRDPPTTAFPGGRPLPNLRAMGAGSAQKDLFVELNAMRTLMPKTHGSADAPYPHSPTATKVVPPHNHMLTPADIKVLGDVYTARGIRPHFDVGDWDRYKSQGIVTHAADWVDDYTSDEADHYLVPSWLARGGELVDERACSASIPTCQFPGYPGTVSWKAGLQLYRDGPVGDDGEELLTPDELAAWTHGERRRRFDADRKGLFHYVLNAHARGKPRSALPCLVDGVPAPYDASGGTACTNVNPEFHIPSSASGVADLPGNSAMVTLGFWDEHVGRPFVRASTTFHELGHNLNLWHGGGEAAWGNKAFGTPTLIEPNCKPMYLSAMSYLFQVHGLWDDAGNIHLDYSNTRAEHVNEALPSDTALFPVPPYRPVWYAPALSPLALGQGAAAATRFCSGERFGTTPPAPMSRVRAPRADAVIDWNGDLLINNGVANQDANFDAAVGPLRGFVDWTSLRLDQIGAGRHAVKFQSGDFVDFGSGDFLDFGSGDFVDFGSGDFLDFGSGDFVDFGSGDFLDFGSGSERQELDFEFAISLGRSPASALNACVIGQDAGCADAAPFTPAYHRTAVSWTSPTFGHVFSHEVSRKRGPDSSAFAYAVAGTTSTTSFVDAVELPNGLAFTYRTQTEFDDVTPHTFSPYSHPVTVTAVNHAPVAGNDAYASGPNGIRNLTRDTGVLANDTDADSPAATIRAVLAAMPQNGQVVLSPDGTFVYVPRAGFIGTDTFTYVANNGMWSEDPTVAMSPNSNVATVTVVVQSPIPVKP
jgi:hypothetical protein